jgi:Flp pilus assembly protein TadG
MRVATKWVIGGRSHRGVAAVEMALLLPVLTLLFVGIVDLGRVFRQYEVVTDCARNGALYASMNDSHAADTTKTKAAALADADAQALSPQPTVSVATGTNADGKYVDVTVTYQFPLISAYFPSPVPLTRTVRMMVGTQP